jgi:hypothetical protein
VHNNVTIVLQRSSKMSTAIDVRRERSDGPVERASARNDIRSAAARHPLWLLIGLIAMGFWTVFCMCLQTLYVAHALYHYMGCAAVVRRSSLYDLAVSSGILKGRYSFLGQFYVAQSDDDGSDDDDVGMSEPSDGIDKLRFAGASTNLILPAKSVYHVCHTVDCKNETKVVSLSLYGSDTRYTFGALQNALVAEEAFPDWTVYVFIPDVPADSTLHVPDDVTAQLREHGAQIQLLDAATVSAVGFGMNQRFLIAEYPNVDRFIVRDSDSR